jgi:AbiTii
LSKRIDEARKVSGALLDDLENSLSKIDAILMRAKRLARLMRDSEAQLWLDLETRGYPEEFIFSDLGSCMKYAASGGRIDLGSHKYYLQSLPEIEANFESDDALLNSLQTARIPTTTVKDFLEKHATEALMATQLKFQAQQKKSYASSKSLYSSMKSAIHNYATDTYLAVELGDIAEDIFEGAHNIVDTFIRSHSPKAAEKIVAINERMSDSSVESRSSALTSCRRLLMDVADSVLPARDEEWKDRKGHARKVGVEQYKNRLLAYLSDLGESHGSHALLESELEHLASRLDVIYEKTCKGVHIDVSLAEARLAVIHTYLFIGELATYGEQISKKG